MTMTTKELLALVDAWRASALDSKLHAITEHQRGSARAESRCADELAPIATALCAEVEALTAQRDAMDAARAKAVKDADEVLHHFAAATARAEAAEAQVEALRKDADRWRAYERELPDSADSTRVFLHGVAVLNAAKLAAKEPTK